MVEKTREILGKDMYMLSCCGGRDSAILWASDTFDAARIGDDIYPVPFQIVCGDAQVFGDAVIINQEVLCGDARIHQKINTKHG